MARRSPQSVRNGSAPSSFKLPEIGDAASPSTVHLPGGNDPVRTLTTAASLNRMIQEHIDSRSYGEYVWHTGVYLHDPDPSGCNWNIEINCNHDALSCGAVISSYLDGLRTTYVIPSDDATAVPAHEAGSHRFDADS